MASSPFVEEAELNELLLLPQPVLGIPVDTLRLPGVLSMQLILEEPQAAAAAASAPPTAAAAGTAGTESAALPPQTR